MRDNVSYGLGILVTVLLSTPAMDAAAQGYPDKVVRVIVPAPPGGALDIVARLATQKLTEALSAQFIVDNRGGAGGAIGSDLAARAAPDGYTLLFTSSSAVSINPYFVSKQTDPLRTFTPIMLVGYSPNVLVVHPSVPAKTVKELIAIAKARPGSLTYASNGTGSLSHVTAALFAQGAGIDILHVPYKGAAPAVIDVVAGHVSLLFAGFPSVMGQVRLAKLRMLAVTSAKRAPIAPEVPTISEVALPGFESTQWWAVYGPAGLPADIVNRLNAEMNKLLVLPDIREKLAAEGGGPAGGTPADLAAYHKADYLKWGEVIRRAGIKP